MNLHCCPREIKQEVIKNTGESIWDPLGENYQSVIGKYKARVGIKRLSSPVFLNL